MFDASVQKELTSDAAVTAIVGDSVWQGTAKQGTPSPYVVWWVVDGFRTLNVSCPAESKKQRIQIDCYSSNQAQAEALRDAVCNAIDEAGQGDVINDFCEPFGEIPRLYHWIIEVEYVLNR